MAISQVEFPALLEREKKRRTVKVIGRNSEHLQKNNLN